MPKVILGILAIVAVAGWAVAAILLNQSSDLGDKLEASNDDRSKLAGELASARDKLNQHLESAGRLDEIGEKVSAAESKVTALEGQLQTAREELQRVKKESEDRGAELAATESRLEGREAEVAALDGEIQRAGGQLDGLRAEADELRRKMEPLRAELAATQSPEVQADAPAKQSGALLTETDKIAKARRQFETVDQNSDGQIDEFEYRYSSTKLMNLVDVNADGFITIDETVLSPDAFKLLETDGDGKIDELEFSDSNTFRQIDIQRKGVITFEDFLAFSKSGTR